MNPSEKHILEIDSVELSFGDRRILSGVYLAVETGGVTAVLGRNGCGKSCLMKILCGSLRADFRSMRIDGVWHDRFRADEVRYLAQQGFIPGWLTVDRALRDFGLPWDDLLAWFPLFGKLRGTKIRALSGGERRILESYLILCSPTQFVMLDEPFFAGRSAARVDAQGADPAGKILERHSPDRPYAPPCDGYHRPPLRAGRRPDPPHPRRRGFGTLRIPRTPVNVFSGTGLIP